MTQTQISGPAVLLILDGWGIAPEEEKNPIRLAQTPVLDGLIAEYAHTELAASGTAVGLLPNQDGNSEAGHLNIGAGRVVKQDVLKIKESIENGTFYKNAAFEQAAHHVQKNNSRVHIMGLLSDKHSGHSNPKHLLAVLDFFRKKNIQEIYLHLFTDGRDTEKFAAPEFLRALQSELQPHEQIATLIGRFYAMDRKKSWDRTQQAYDTLTNGKTLPCFGSCDDAIRSAYESGESDEFLTPRIICEPGDAVHDSRIRDNDAIVFFNLRSDRARQLAKVFVQKDFEKHNPGSFKRNKVLHNTVFVAMTDFGPDLDHILTAFPSEDLQGTLPEALSEKRQLYIAESEKFAHVTFFLNGGHADPVGGEDRLHIPSPNVASYDETPEMSTIKVTDIILDKLQHDAYDFIVANFANADMVGHTGNLEACIKAVRCIDEQIGRIVRVVQEKGGVLFITADHGNVEEIITATGEQDTEHSTNPVPFIMVYPDSQQHPLRTGGALADIAPTILDVLGVTKPQQMNKKSLLQ